MSLQPREVGRWHARVELDASCKGLCVAGATLVLVDANGFPLGPLVVLPVENPLQGSATLEVQLRGPKNLPSDAKLRLSAFIPDQPEPLIIDQWVSQKRGFHAYIFGNSSPRVGACGAGRTLTLDEKERLCHGFPWLTEALPRNEAFEAFKDDLLSSLDLDENDEVTEEILRMLQES